MNATTSQNPGEERADILLDQYSLRLPSHVSSADNYRKLANSAYSILELIIAKKAKGILPKNGAITSAHSAYLGKPLDKTEHRINIEDIAEGFELKISKNVANLKINLYPTYSQPAFDLDKDKFMFEYRFKRHEK